MRRCRDICMILSFLPVVFSHPLGLTAAEPDFESEIAPLLVKRCVECHRPGEDSGNLNLTSRGGLLKGGDSGEVIDLQDVSQSYLLERLKVGEMPPTQKGLSRKLPDAEIELLQQWIAAGAKWPDDRVLDLFEKTNDVRAGRDWWSLQPIERPELPQPARANASTNPIDLFVQRKLAQAGMEPAPRAERRILLRRLHDVITGLPPTQEEQAAFLQDESPQAWEKKVDQLLASPHYGERWARHWLDLVRYADTSGYERDQDKPFAWKYRDWVVNAFNNDMPYDRFITLQLAGDEVPDRSAETVVATGMLRLGTWNDEPNDPEDYQYDRLEDLVHVTSSAFLGLTVKCARCHAHKFDPIRQEDYYRMASAFWSGPIAQRDRALLGGPSAEELGFPEILGWTDLGNSPRPFHLLKHGERAHPQQEIQPASLSFFPELEHNFEPPAADATTTTRRLQLARWIADPRNPLPARVMVNRIWLHLFGEGIVRTPNNFGFLADPPTHPELLDWLAAEFIESGWSVKHIQRLILTSDTWQQSSVHPREKEYSQRDSGNRLGWKADRRRRDAESLRDAMLFVSGEIDLKLGGPGFHATIAPEALEGLSRKDAAWQASPPEEQRRRSLYMYSARGLLSPLMTTFDFNDTTLPCGQRDSTTVPTQSLALLNNQFVHDRSEAVARSIEASGGTDNDLVQAVWLRILGRQPSPQETKLAINHLQQQRERFRELHSNESKSTPESLALASLCHVLLNSNEFLHID